MSVSQVFVRAATLADFPALAATDELAVPGSDRWDDLHGFANGTQGWCLLAETHEAKSSSVVGYVAVAPGHFFGRDFVELLVVAGSARRLGIGSQLLEAAVHRAASATMFTSTNESNAAMRALLNASGWHISGVLEGLDEGDPEIVFYRAV